MSLINFIPLKAILQFNWKMSDLVRVSPLFFYAIASSVIARCMFPNVRFLHLRMSFTVTLHYILENHPFSVRFLVSLTPFLAHSYESQSFWNIKHGAEDWSDRPRGESLFYLTHHGGPKLYYCNHILDDFCGSAEY